jgi:4-hydroxy-tetrahydrodipicolinate synthase
MSTSNINLSGVIPIVPTPFDVDGDIDLGSFRNVLDYLVQSGVHGVAVLGMASEGFAVTDRERDLLVRTAAEQVNGAVPLVVGCSHSSAHAVAELAVASSDAGADALMVMPPALGSPIPAAVVEYFAAVDAAVDIPIMVQDNPAWTGMRIQASVYEKIADLAHVSYVKVETPHPPTTMRLISDVVGDSLILFGGLAGNWLPEELRSGIAGTMPASIMPQVYVGVWELWASGRHDEALALFHRFHPVIRVSGQPSIGIAMAKQLLVSAGAIKAPFVRSPLRQLSDQDRNDLEAVAAELDLIDVMRGTRTVSNAA